MGMYTVVNGYEEGTGYEKSWKLQLHRSVNRVDDVFIDKSGSGVMSGISQT